MDPSPRLRRPLRKNGTADCPQCGGADTVARHNANWACHVCHFVEVVDNPTILPAGRWRYEDDLTVSPMTFTVSQDQMVRTSTGNVLHLSKAIRHDKRPSLAWAGSFIRPVVRRDGVAGECECRTSGYTVRWRDGTEIDCADISYVGAEFTDVGSHRRAPLPPTPRARGTKQTR
jgi:ribosomal protein S27AE